MLTLALFSLFSFAQAQEVILSDGSLYDDKMRSALDPVCMDHYDGMLEALEQAEHYANLAEGTRNPVLKARYVQISNAYYDAMCRAVEAAQDDSCPVKDGFESMCGFF